MKKIVIDGALLPTKDALHDTLASAFGFPEWYGRNLDALLDCLTDVTEETAVYIENFDELNRSLPIYAGLLVRVLRRACRENPRLSCTVDRDDPEEDE